jgi:glycerol uptake facilitator-like aquaporin
VGGRDRLCLSDGNENRESSLGALFSEFVGTALLISAGLSVVIIDFSPDSPAVSLIQNEGVRRLMTGFLFGATGGLIAVSTEQENTK